MAERAGMVEPEDPHLHSLALLEEMLVELKARVWPDGVAEPSWSGPSLSVDFPDGYFHSRWPDGRLRALILVTQGRVGPWLRLDELGTSGCLWLGNCGEKYYADGLLEDFSPWDDTSKPYPAGISLGEWALQSACQYLSPAPSEPSASQTGAPPGLSADSGFELPVGDEVPRLHLPLSGSGPLPDDLDTLLTDFRHLRLVCPCSCFNYLVRHRGWDAGWARDFTILAPHAAQAAFAKSAEPKGELLYPLWDRPGQIGRIPLANLPLYTRVFARAQESCRAHGVGQRHWVNDLLDALPTRVRQGASPDPVSWTQPPEDLDGFYMVATCITLMLRQEATRGAELASYLESVDAEAFFQAGGIAGAFLLGGRLSGQWNFELDRPPWTSGHNPSAYLSGLGSLIAGFDESEVLLRYPHYADSRESPVPMRLPPTWRKAPLLAALGQWAHSQCGEGLPGPDSEPTVYNLARFINAHAGLLEHRLAAFRRGNLWWEYESEIQEWPVPGMNEMGGWEKYFALQRFEVREQGELFAESPELASTLPGFSINAFLLRLEVASTILVRGPRASDDSWGRCETSLRDFLARNPKLSQTQIGLLREHVLGPEAELGPSYQRILLALLWVLSEWSDAEKNPALIFPALRLMQGILPAL